MENSVNTSTTNNTHDTTLTKRCAGVGLVCTAHLRPKKEQNGTTNSRCAKSIIPCKRRHFRALVYGLKM